MQCVGTLETRGMPPESWKKGPCGGTGPATPHGEPVGDLIKHKPHGELERKPRRVKAHADHPYKSQETGPLVVDATRAIEGLSRRCIARADLRQFKRACIKWEHSPHKQMRDQGLVLATAWRGRISCSCFIDGESVYTVATACALGSSHGVAPRVLLSHLQNEAGTKSGLNDASICAAHRDFAAEHRGPWRARRCQGLCHAWVRASGPLGALLA